MGSSFQDSTTEVVGKLWGRLGKYRVKNGSFRGRGGGGPPREKKRGGGGGPPWEKKWGGGGGGTPTGAPTGKEVESRNNEMEGERNATFIPLR